jgi:hypothetical protein
VIAPRYCNSYNVEYYHPCIGTLLPLLSSFASDRRCFPGPEIFMASTYYIVTCEFCIPPILDTGCGFVSRLSARTFRECSHIRVDQHPALTHSQRRVLHYLLDFHMVQPIMGTTLSGKLSYAAIMLYLSQYEDRCSTFEC